MASRRGAGVAALLLTSTLLHGVLAVGGFDGIPDLRLPHVPISIESDADFRAPNSGVVGGSGTVQDPYLIAGWEIIPTKDPAIKIEHTRASVVIRDVFIHGFQPAGFQTGGNAIFLNETMNVAVDHSTIGPGVSIGLLAVDSQ